MASENFLRNATRSMQGQASLRDLLVRSPPPVADIRARLASSVGGGEPITDTRMVRTLLSLHDPEVNALVLRRRQDGTDSWPLEGNFAPLGALGGTYRAHVLHVASQEGAMNVIEWILEQDSAAVEFLDTQGHTPLYTRHPQALRRLLETPYVAAVINGMDRFGETPLHYACSGNMCVDCVRALLEKSAEVDMQQKYGMTPLHKVMYTYFLRSNVPEIPFEEVIRTLMLAGASYGVEDSHDMTARDLAARDPQLMRWFNAVVPAADQISGLVSMTPQESTALRLFAERAMNPAATALRMSAVSRAPAPAPPASFVPFGAAPAPAPASFGSFGAAPLPLSMTSASLRAPSASMASFGGPSAPSASMASPSSFSFASPAASFASSFATPSTSSARPAIPSARPAIGSVSSVPSVPLSGPSVPSVYGQGPSLLGPGPSIPLRRPNNQGKSTQGGRRNKTSHRKIYKHRNKTYKHRNKTYRKSMHRRRS